MALIVDRDVSEVAVGHQYRMHLLAAQHPGLEMDGNRGLADPDQIGVNRDYVADEHRFAKIHRIDCDRHRPGLRDLGRKDAAADIHLAEQPAAENVAVRIFASKIAKSRTVTRSEEHTSELQSHSDLVCR